MNVRNAEPPMNAASLPLPDGQSSRPAGALEGGESNGAIIAAVVANVLVGIVKFIAAAISGSSAMISEGIHSLVDSGNGLLLLFGRKRASRLPDAEHPFGYSHELYFWTLVVALMIFAFGGGLSVYEGVQHIVHADAEALAGSPIVNYVVIILAMVIEGGSLSVALKEFNHARGGVPALRFIREAKDPSLFTVVLEDSAAELGLFFALAGVFFSHLFGNPAIDGAASVLIGLLLIGVAVLLLKETKGLLIGEGMKKAEVERIEKLVEADEAVIECGRILSLYLGPHDLLLTIDASFEKEATSEDIIAAIDRIEGGIVAEFPNVTRIFIETESLRHTEGDTLLA